MTIDKKIMAFTGTSESKILIDNLAEYTDNIYAVVAPEYGKVPYPGGNITVISKHLTEEQILSWIERTGIDIIIDGCAVPADDDSQLIKKISQNKNLEYIKISAQYELNPRMKICRSIDELSRNVEYTTGNILIKADIDLIESLMKTDTLPAKTVPLIHADITTLERIKKCGIPTPNIICIDKILSVDFLLSLFQEFKITHMIMAGTDKNGMAERIEASDISKTAVSVYGDFADSDGISSDKAWEKLSKIFDID